MLLDRCSLLVLISFFFFKQKTAYEMLSGDWSSDVCSSDLRLAPLDGKTVSMPGHGYRRPEDNGKKPEKDNNQRDRMRDDLDQPTSGAPKNGHGSQANKQWELSAYVLTERPSALRLMAWFRLSRHGREHTESMSAMQSSDSLS